MTAVIDSIVDWQEVRQEIGEEYSIGFVPTMGNLHKGHEALIERAMHETDFVVVSLFVNPTQFNDKKDFRFYPRTLEEDIAIAERMDVDCVFTPSKEALYLDDYAYQISETQVSHTLEGTFRPGHFTGMLTVMMKLLNIIKPTQVYMGEKDYQQLNLVRGLVASFFMDIQIVSCPTVREQSGLPLSSRNQRLTDEAKQLAKQFAEIFHQPKQDCQQIKQALELAGIDVEYLEDVYDRRFVAVHIDGVRLIDNYSIF